MMKRIFSLILTFSLVLSLFSCGERVKEDTFFAMNTFFTVKAEYDGTEDILSLIRNRAEKTEKIFSFTLVDSLVSRLNKGEEISFNAGEDEKALKKLIEISLFSNDISEGYFSPVLGRLTSLWDINGEEPKIPTEADIAEALAPSNISNITVNEKSLSLKNGAALDMGGCAKGYTADEFIKVLSENSVSRAVISLGGNILCYGASVTSKDNTEIEKPSFSIGLRAPFIEDDSLCGKLIDIPPCVISVSGGYERYMTVNGEIYHHIISPFTGKPAETDLACAIVISKNLENNCGALADCHSTALYAAGFDKAIEIYEKIKDDFHIILIKESMNIYASDEIKEHLELAKDYKYIN